MKPEIGRWYKVTDGADQLPFEVVALDEDDNVVEMQYEDGTVDEMDIEDWEGYVDDGFLHKVTAPTVLSVSDDADNNQVYDGELELDEG